jgi:hypothetical protein
LPSSTRRTIAFFSQQVLFLLLAQPHKKVGVFLFFKKNVSFPEKSSAKVPRFFFCAALLWPVGWQEVPCGGSFLP